MIGANYEPSGINLLLSKMLVVSKYILMAIVGSSFELFAYLGMATPMFWTWALENKLFAIMMIFFFGSKCILYTLFTKNLNANSNN